MRRLPPVDAGLAGRQQSALHARCEIEILFERPHLGGRQVVETHARERVGQQAVRLDRLVAGLAEAVGLGVHPTEGGVDFPQQSNNLSRLNPSRGRLLQEASPAVQLVTQDGLDGNWWCRHGTPPRGSIELTGPGPCMFHARSLIRGAGGCQRTAIMLDLR